MPLRSFVTVYLHYLTSQVGAIAQTSASGLSISRDDVEFTDGNDVRFGRRLLTVDPNCTSDCNDTFTTCYAGCGNQNCRTDCTANQTVCMNTCHHCGNVSDITNGNVTYSNGDFAGSVATYTCNGGFQLQAGGGGSTRSCDLATDTWIDSVNRSCVGVFCAALNVPVNGGSDLPVGQSVYPTTANFLCNPGFNLTGTTKRVYCGWDGFWYKTNGTKPSNLFNYPGDLPTCTDINECTNTSLCPQKCTNTVGSYTCDCFAGYYSSGGQCLGLPCQHLSGNFSYTVNGTNLESANYDCAYPCNATLVCNIGHVPLNQSMQTCLSNQSWNQPASQMICIGKLCSRSFPAPSPSYTVTISTGWAAYPPSGRFNDILTITCNEGYEAASGNFTWTCLGDGTWGCGGGSCTMPNCTGKICDLPPTYSNGNANMTNGGRYPAYITYPCDPGYNQTGANGNYSCLSTLNWQNINPPVCSGKFCGVSLFKSTETH